jgi:thiosulfate reductase cytochrome b subunit
MMALFFVVHVYFATTGHTPIAHIKAMITGYEEV